MTGSPERFGVCTPSTSRHSSTFAVLCQRSVRIVSPRASFTSKPAITVASDATGDGPEYRYGEAAVFKSRFSSVGQAMNAASDEYDFENPETSTTLS